MKVMPMTEVAASSWDALCLDSSRAWLFHSSQWIGIESSFFPHRNLSFAIVNGEDVIGVQPLYASETGLNWIERLVHSGIHRHTGLALRDDLDAATVNAARAAAMRQIDSVAALEQADRIQLNAQALAPAAIADGAEAPFWVIEHGFQFGLQFGPNGMMPAPGMTTCCVDQIVSLGAAEEQLFARLDESCRRAVRKALAAGLAFEAFTTREAIDLYWPIAQVSAARTGENLPARAYYEAVVDTFAPSGRCVVLLAKHEGRHAAGLILLVDKGGASFLAGASHPEFLPMRVNDFLHWSAIAWSRLHGLQQYRLGPFFPEVPADWPIARVSRFKTKFGGRSVPVVQGSRFIHPQKYRAGALQQVELLCAPLPSP